MFWSSVIEIRLSGRKPFTVSMGVQSVARQFQDQMWRGFGGDWVRHWQECQQPVGSTSGSPSEKKVVKEAETDAESERNRGDARLLPAAVKYRA